MCREVKCRKCSKPTWAGCGAHVETVLAHVPRAQRCTCRETASTSTSTSTSTKPGFFARLLGRG